MNIQKDQIIGELVAQDYRVASVLNTYGIDFCCQGNRSIQEACTRENIDPDKVISDIQNILHSTQSEILNYQSWPIDLLADYIEKKHHRYVEEKIIEIKPYLDKICKVHGNHHPELFEIRQLFFAAADELTEHMKKEETILFPYIQILVQSHRSKNKPDRPFFGNVQNPVQVMMHEHTTEGERFSKMEELSNTFTPPDDACNTYRLTFSLLKEFKQDLHLHIHLENNILFPKAIELESEFF